MDYFILKTTDGQYWCVNSIVRCKDQSGVDITTCICSGVSTTIDTIKIVSITPSTPTF